MKKLITFLLALIMLAGINACKKKTDDSNDLGGDSSPMAAVGTVVTSSSATISGVSNLTATVVSQSGGVSYYNGSGIITNSAFKNILSNFSEITIHGDSVSVTGFKVKQTLDGIECQSDIGPGIIVKYASNVGDSYQVGSTGRTRTVVSKSSTDDYYYGFFLIKVMQVEELTPSLKSIGVSKVTYWANHKFGLVGIQYNFTDGSSVNFPVYCSTSNE
ncbi:MAG TPA: hypothetical protein VMC08_00645 [Bacteroidales bacterium]|nr:hypothetical protein [Bacteroidales bacterium]